MKKAVGIGILSVGLILSGCSSPGSEEKVGEKEQVQTSSTDGSTQEFVVTKNTSRIIGSDAE